VLFGVPNQGLRHEQLITIVQGRQNQELIQSLVTDRDSEPSAYLDELTKKFANVCKTQQPPLKIISYYERKKSPTAKIGCYGRVTMTGPPQIMVTKSSAERVGSEIRDIEHIPSDTDHRGLVRFDHRQQDEYDSVRGKLCDMVSCAPNIVRQRFRGIQG